jgi:hypothetical protein
MVGLARRSGGSADSEKAKAWGVDWARTSDSKRACSSEGRDTGRAIGTGMGNILIVQKGQQNMKRTWP